MMKGMKELQKEKNNKTKKKNIFEILKKRFSELNTGKKVQAIIASVFTVALLIALPVYHAPLKQMTV